MRFLETGRLEVPGAVAQAVELLFGADLLLCAAHRDAVAARLLRRVRVENAAELWVAAHHTNCEALAYACLVLVADQWCDGRLPGAAALKENHPAFCVTAWYVCTTINGANPRHIPLSQPYDRKGFTSHTKTTRDVGTGAGGSGDAADDRQRGAVRCCTCRWSIRTSVRQVEQSPDIVQYNRHISVSRSSVLGSPPHLFVYWTVFYCSPKCLVVCDAANLCNSGNKHIICFGSILFLPDLPRRKRHIYASSFIFFFVVEP